MLAASYGRESFQRGERLHGRHAAVIGLLARSAAEVAYALRWLEIEGRLDATPWIALLAGPGADRPGGMHLEALGTPGARP